MCPKTISAKLKNKDQQVNEKSIYGFGKNSINLYDCLCAIDTAVKHNFVNFDDFNFRKYYWSRDFTWIVQRKLIAFRGPTAGFRAGRRFSDLSFYVEYFRRTNVKTVVRLNRVEYDSTR